MEMVTYFKHITDVSTCYVFKNRLQEYAQKVGLPTPVYETIKEGPSREPMFTSTVIVNDVRYESLPRFFNRKATEQSAAEVALMRLVNSGSMENLSQPVHETGLCKNLLQEYAQKMNFAIPKYECRRYDPEGKVITFSCTVDVGGMRYVGAAARTKKEAEIKAARTALLAIQSSSTGPNGYSAYTVLPMKKVTDLSISNQESAAALKPKKNRFKKKKKRNVCTRNTGDVQVQMVNQGTESPAPLAPTMGDPAPFNISSSVENRTALVVSQNDRGTSTLGINSQFGGAGTAEGNAVIGVEQVTSEVHSSTVVITWRNNSHVR
ncbi:double-stranded RNA-binding protein 1-like [Capsicum annuum]|uniref:double-stranded RNA-binding protein 1-like n=1 Tax=Capsicum annuum TaxID=4072 RepID=UPI001FB10573|nr:double-stranded RNA-binding protein 1-like [Capsicum annuum]